MNPLGRRVYRYVPAWKTITLGILFFGGGAALGLILARNNTRGLRLFRFIDLSPPATSRFMIIMSIVCLGFVAAAILGLWRRVARPQEIVMDDDGLVVPKSFLAREGQRVPYSQIKEHFITEVSGDRFLKIRLQDGTRHSITQSLLPSRDAFDEIVAALRARAALVPPS